MLIRRCRPGPDAPPGRRADDDGCGTKRPFRSGMELLDCIRAFPAGARPGKRRPALTRGCRESPRFGPARLLPSRHSTDWKQRTDLEGFDFRPIPERLGNDAPFLSIRTLGSDRATHVCVVKTVASALQPFECKAGLRPRNSGVGLAGCP